MAELLAERIGAYRLLAHLLAAPPAAEDLAMLAGLQADDTEIGSSLGPLAAAARDTDAETASRQFERLFIGLGGGELVPFASHYLTGSLHDLPLAHLRHDMRRLGMRQAGHVHEPEDHASTVLELMGGLVAGRYAADENEQARFFWTYAASWLPRLFADLAAVSEAPLYAAVGSFGRVFLAGELRWFEDAGGRHRDPRPSADGPLAAR